MRRLGALESLRGLLALWVVIGHVVGRTFSSSELERAHLSLLSQPILAVYVFIILSGFVIMYLLDHDRLGYIGFVARRFLRLAPLYVTVLVVAALTLGFQIRTIEALPWRNSDIENTIATQTEALTHLWQHLLSHVLMIQGLLSERMLKYANYTLVGQSWSISLEWQFYLIAPFIFALIAARRWLVLSACVLVFALLFKINYGGVGFIGNQFGYFLVGIASYFAFKFAQRPMEIAPAFFDFFFVALAALLAFFLRMPWPLVTWALVLLSVISVQQNAAGPLTSRVIAFLDLPLLRWAGEISYSVYLIHLLVFYALVALVTTYVPHITQLGFIAVVLPGTIGLTLALSTATYRLIERPGIELGRRLSHRISRGITGQPATST